MFQHKWFTDKTKSHKNHTQSQEFFSFLVFNSVDFKEILASPPHLALSALLAGWG